MFRFVVVSVTALVGVSSWAETACAQHFAAGKAPIVTNTVMRSRTQEVCFQAYAVLHSGISRTPLYSAEHLTRKNLEQAKKLPRRDSFHAEKSLPPEDRAELSDYARSGYDRGHMAPNADFANASAQAESFSLANMVPQVDTNNAGVWAGIEGATRLLALSDGELYVISGPAFLGKNIKKVGNVLVPTHLWKVVYSPKQQRAGAYMVINADTRDYSIVSVSELEKTVGISLLPGLPQKIRDAGMNLPKPQPSGQRGSKDKPVEFTLKDLARLILDALLRMK